MYGSRNSGFGFGLAAFIGAMLGFGFICLKMVVTPAGMVTVMEDRPIFFGAEGVRQEVLTPGRSWEWVSSKGTQYPVVPFTLTYDFNDLPTKDTALLDFDTSIQLLILDARLLHEKFTESWADANLFRPFNSAFRDITKQHTMTEIMTSPSVAAEMEAALLEKLNTKMKDEGIPVVITDFNLGQGRPNDDVVEQMNKTLAQQQARKTFEEMDKAQQARLNSETSRAAADKAYADAMGYSPAQLVQLDYNARFSEVCAKSTCVISASGMPLTIPLK